MAQVKIPCLDSQTNENERTFIMIKPDGVKRGLIGKIIKRFEQRGYHLSGLKMVRPDEDLMKQHYSDLVDKPFYPGLVTFMCSGPVVAMVWVGFNVVKAGRTMLGETNTQNNKPGTIRGDYGILTNRNICHGSDSVESAQREIDLWFDHDELDYSIL